MKILIVEDTEIHAKMMIYMLNKLKKGEIITACDAFEGYAVLKAIPNIDVIIMDFRLPYVNGLEFIQKLRNTDLYKNIPVIISSADDDTETFLKAGACSVLNKPYTQECLLLHIENILQNAA